MAFNKEEGAGSSEAAPLPSAPLKLLAQNASLQPPLSRRGHGPGLIIITPDTDIAIKNNNRVTGSASPPHGADTLDPLPQKKWAEEGYAVVRLVFPPSVSAQDADAAAAEAPEWTDVRTALPGAINALARLQSCDLKDKFAIIVYGTPEEYPASFAPKLRSAFEETPGIVASLSFSTAWDLSSKPELLHLTGTEGDQSRPTVASGRSVHKYPTVSSPSFIVPGHPEFRYATAGVAHTGSLTFIKQHLGGPMFDLEAIWDEHTYFEFAERSVEKTMATMVDEPYVNHVPTMTGGIGRARLTEFYRDHFIFSNPDDTALELVSRTVGIDRVVDEFVFSLTHDRVVDWLLPGVPATYKKLRIPFTSIVNIRGDRLYHEHISWDQSTALTQAGLLPEYLPFPYAVPGANPTAKLEYRIPSAGVETARKLEDQSAVESNAMFDFTAREIGG